MGLLDTIANQVMGSLATCDDGRHAQVVNAIGGFIQQQGGLENLINTFHQRGLGNVVSSWVGTGQNLPISAGPARARHGQRTGAGHGAEAGLFAAGDVGPSRRDPAAGDRQAHAGGAVPAGGGLAAALGMLKVTS